MSNDYEPLEPNAAAAATNFDTTSSGSSNEQDLLFVNPTVAIDGPEQLNELDQQALASCITQDYSQWKTARSQLEATWRECWEAYLCDVGALYAQPDEETADRSRIARPVLYESVEAIHVNLMNTILPANERFFNVLGKTEKDQRDARTIEAFLHTKLAQMGFTEKFAQFIKQAIITGNSVAAVPWRKESRLRRTTKPVTFFGVPIAQQKLTVEELMVNGPDFEVLDIFDFLIDPDEPDFERAKVIRKVQRPLRWVLNNPVYTNTQDLQTQTDSQTDSNKVSKRSAFGIQEGALQNTSGRKDMVNLLEAWGDFEVNGKLYANYVCVVANGERVIRFEPNPYDHGMKPFIFSTFIPVPNEVYGLGAIEKSLGLQHAINTLTNQKLDVINISINNPFTYLVNDEVFDPDTVVTRPGALIPVKSHDTLRPLTYLNNFTVAFNEIADLKNEIQEATGALKYFTGSPTDFSISDRTATEVNALINGGTQRFSHFVSHIENTSLEPFLTMVFENAKQFMQEPETLRIARVDGSLDFVEILPRLLQRAQCDFRIDGSQASINKSNELETIISFIKLVQENPHVADNVNLLELYRKVYRRLGFKDEEQIFLPGRPPVLTDEAGEPKGLSTTQLAMLQHLVSNNPEVSQQIGE